MEFYYAKEDRSRQGPVSQEELRSLFQTGQINRDTLIWKQGMADWQPLATLAWLQDELSRGAGTATDSGVSSEMPVSQAAPAAVHPSSVGSGSPGSSGGSGGTIAIVIISVVALLGAIGGASYYFYQKQRSDRVSEFLGSGDSSRESSSETRYMRVTARPNLRMRSAPNLAGTKVGFPKYGEIVEFIEEVGPPETHHGLTGRWTKIRYQGIEGYVFGPFLEPVR